MPRRKKVKEEEIKEEIIETPVEEVVEDSIIEPPVEDVSETIETKITMEEPTIEEIKEEPKKEEVKVEKKEEKRSMSTLAQFLY